VLCACGSMPADGQRDRSVASGAAASTAGQGGGDTTPSVLPPANADVTLIPLPDEDAGTLSLPAMAKRPADPNITFDWKETLPGTDACSPGRYVGTFSCTFVLTGQAAQLAPNNIMLTGPLTLTLMKSANGEFLEISDGEFAAIAVAVIGARASLQGKLDCATDRFTATLHDGAWALGDPAMPLLPGGTLNGDLTGMYDGMQRTLSGVWTIGDPSVGTCMGTWTVSLTP
jgi:hypothetical protein